MKGDIDFRWEELPKPKYDIRPLAEHDEGVYVVSESDLTSGNPKPIVYFVAKKGGKINWDQT
jgi:hypothetical protein